jgi:drug/metabolite transporter (DMT)-like permease
LKHLLPLLLALAGAIFLSGGGALQWLGHERSGRTGTPGWKVALSPLWWSGILLGALGNLCHYAALWIGLVALVLPVSSLHIALTALLMSRLRKEAVQGKRAAGIALVAVGVILCLAGQSGIFRSRPIALSAAGGTAILLALAGAVATLSRRASSRWAAGSGLAFAAAAVSWKILSQAGPTFPRAVAAAVFAATFVAGFLLMQGGFRRGGAAAVNATSTGIATVLAMVAASSLLGEPVPAASWIGTLGVALGVLLVGWRNAPS